MYDPVAFTIPEGLNYDEFIVATYLFQSQEKVNIHKIALALSEEQTCGTWVTLPGETNVVRERHLGRILAMWEVPDHEYAVPEGVGVRNWVIQIGFPVHNIGAQFPLLLTAVHGNIAAAGRIKLLDLHFPKMYCDYFKGPRFGIKGMRELLGVPERPLVHAMIKPNMGLTPEESADAFYNLASGGCDAVKDDELIVSHPWSEFLDRVKLHRAQAKKVYDDTGHKCLFFVNITDRADRLVENAKRALDAGADALMVNYLVVGISALSIIADNSDINVPLLAHLDFSGALYTDPWSGVSSHLVLGKFPRLAGADVVVYPSPYGKFPFLAEKHLRIARSLTDRFHGLKRAWPMPGGGVHPGMVQLLFDDMYKDFMVGVGGAAHGHPQGAAAGARALRQAVDAVMQKMPLIEAAEQHPELKAAIDAWGVSESGVQGKYDLLGS